MREEGKRNPFALRFPGNFCVGCGHYHGECLLHEKSRALPGGCDDYFDRFRRRDLPRVSMEINKRAED
jgi:hypothetical protein